METKGGTFRVSLACPADGGRYDDCVKPDDSFAVIQALVRLSGRGRVTLQAASSKCADGDARPRLAGAGTDGARMFVLTGPGVQLELNSLILDGLSLRPGIFAENAKRLVLRKVDLQNFTASSCDAYSFLNKGCGGALLTYATPVTVEDGAFSGNTAAFSGSGGAIYAGARPAARGLCHCWACAGLQICLPV
jgi:predicted outer membrane repeat protein